MKKVIFAFIMILAINANTSIVSACTIFTVTKDGVTMVGNNEDDGTLAVDKQEFDKGSKVWFLPKEHGKYGRMFFGFRDAYPFGGMNEKGLFFDFYASNDRQKAPESPEKMNYAGCLGEKILEECSTVDQALDMYKKYNDLIFEYVKAEIMYVDKLGNSALVSWDWEKNELNVKKKSGSFQVLGDGYKIVYPELAKNSSQVSVDRFRKLLDNAHQGDLTIYSNIYDLNRKEVNLYYHHNYDYSIKLNLEDELKKGKHFYTLYDLFPGQNFKISMKDYFFKTFSAGETGLFVILILAFFAPFIIWPVYFLGRRFKENRNMDRSGSFLHISWIVTILNGIVGLLILYLLFGYMPFVGKYGFEIIAGVFTHLPLYLLLLTAGQILVLVFAWTNRHWSKLLRVLFSVTTICIVYFLLLLNTWSLLPI